MATITPSEAFENAAATGGVSTISHVGLVDESGTELSGGSYARQAATWGAASAGGAKLSADLTFSVPGGATVAGWKGFDAATSGTDFGGSDLAAEAYTNDGTYVLTGADTGYTVTAA